MSKKNWPAKPTVKPERYLWTRSHPEKNGGWFTGEDQVNVLIAFVSIFLTKYCQITPVFNLSGSTTGIEDWKGDGRGRAVAGPEILKKGGGRKTMYQPRRHLSQIHTTNCTPFIREKTAYWRKNPRPMGDGPTADKATRGQSSRGLVSSRTIVNSPKHLI